ncbi:thioesterase family protein [Corallococcus sp. H22C18031201]|uniref:acyl-CoA thioesterase n=1 Tax=Citreicoccus inhibens TaxID=2849499 RepID=UPI000E715DFA|nr:thioesterase family protein [Citreicoccus inhibens]MBU8898812.1 thioesterase family protein [Citreicoccus inhibens]RJS24004.1 thioesterase family protein [Corallococcus sp. H22C18031201]
MTAAFLAATLVEPLNPGHYLARYTTPWYQGKGAYGGVVAGQVLRAMEHHVADAGRPVRSFTAHFCSPAVEGPAEIHTRLERAGKLVTHATARAENAAGVVCVATATFGGTRSGAVTYDEWVMPQVPPPSEVGMVPDDAPMPDFCRFFEYRYCVGAAPYSGADTAEVGGWLRPREPLTLDAALLVGLMDAYPPSVLSRVEGFRPAASVDFTVHFFHSLPREGLRPDMHYLRVGRSRQASEGYSEEFQQLWTEDGLLLAQCRQLVAVLG